MHEEIVIKKEELDIDDTKIKLELDEDAPQLDMTCGKYECFCIDNVPLCTYVCVCACVRAHGCGFACVASIFTTHYTVSFVLIYL